MTDPKQTMKVEFAPGAFDNFDGTQQELDQLQREVIEMFQNLTPEELAARSSPLDEETFAELCEENPTMVETFINNMDRKLQ
jgi:hypothetical protein